MFWGIYGEIDITKNPKLLLVKGLCCLSAEK